MNEEIYEEMDEELARLSKVIIPIMDILYNSDLEFDECVYRRTTWEGWHQVSLL